MERIQKFLLQKASHDSTQTLPGHCFMHNHSNNDIFENIAVGIGWCIWYHDEHELNPLMDKFSFFSKNIYRIVIIRLVLESWMSELSLGCFPIEFGPFLMIL